MDTKFMKMNYDLLRMDGLTSTDKLVLGFNRSHERYYASNEYAAEVLGMTVSAVKKSIIKLRKLGLWKEVSRYRGNRRSDTPVTNKDTRVTKSDTRVADKKSILPMKNSLLLDSRLERDKKEKEGLNSAAGAAVTESSAATSLKIKETKSDSVSETNFNGRDTASEARLRLEEVKKTPPKVHVGSDGTPLSKEDMAAANFEALLNGGHEVYGSDAIKAAPAAKPDLAREFELVFGKPSEPPETAEKRSYN